MEKSKVLIFISHYLPGYKMGGPTNSVFNIATKLKENYDFYIITSDRDFGDTVPYEGIENGKWLNIKGNKVMYFDPQKKYYSNIKNHLKKNSYDTVYLNSLFEFKFSIFIILLNFLKIVKNNRIIVAPRGELYEEALAFGGTKKSIFLKLIKGMGMYRKVIWHSTGSTESESIYSNFPKANVELARVISDYSNETLDIEAPDFILKEDNFLKIIYLSRISKDKNLIFAIRLLAKVKDNVEFHIYGPIEDQNIWDECLEGIKLLPENVKVQYKGQAEKKYAKSYFSKYDLFLLPTHRENFGHVINESLSVGTPVLISDNTPWRDLESKKLGWDVSLKNENKFIDIISEYSKKSKEEKYNFRNTVLKSYAENIDQDNIIKENIKLFKSYEYGI